MLNQLFRQSTRISYNPLRDNSSSDEVSLDIRSHVKTFKVIRHSRDKFIKRNLKEKSRTLHTLSLSRLPTNNRSLREFCPRNGEIEKTISHLRRLKSLRCLNVDLCWLLTIKKGHARLIESLKHMKNLSMIHFYVKEENIPLFHIPHLYQSVSNVRMIPKAEIRLSFLHPFGIAGGGSFDQLLRALSSFGCLTSVDLTFDYFSFLAIQGTIASLQAYKFVTKIDITITKIYSLSNSPRLQESIFESLKRVKSLKSSKITFKGLGSLPLTDFGSLIKRLKEAAQIFNIEITFQMKANIFERLSLSEWEEFVGSLQKSDYPYRLHVNYIGKFRFSLKCRHCLIILVPLVFVYSIAFLVEDLFLDWK